MRKFIKSGISAALALMMAVAFPASAQAATYKDISPSHYAYAAVDWVSNPANGSFMVGDASNNFNPNRTLDKFEIANIIALAAGYKYNPTPAEQEIFDRAYETYKPYLDSKAAQYAKWSKTADRAIAYLMYRNVLTGTDLESFITKTNGIETVNNLTKQEAIVFMIRMDGKQSNVEAITLPYRSPYNDDAQIKAEYKKYIYYAKETGIAIGSDGSINPNREVTRAEMAQMFYNMLGSRVNTQPTLPSTPTSTATTTVTGVVESVYQDTYVYITANNVPSLYSFATNALIFIDNLQKSATFLVKGMNVTAVVNANNQIVSLVARTGAADTPATPTTPTAGLSEDEGYVAAISTLQANSLSIKTQRVKLTTGEIIQEEKAYTLATNCTINRGTKTVLFADIKVNDIISFKYSGTVLYEISLQEKDRTITGTLIEKKYVETSSTPVMVIEDDKGVKYELRITSSTYFQRGNSRNLTWSDIRVGDSIEAQCEYDRILNVYASGKRSTVSGTIEEIRLSENTQQVVLRKNDRTVETYAISSDTFDIYELRVGMGVKLYLDSREIYDMEITSDPRTYTNYLIGYIQSIRSGSTIVVADSTSSNANTYSVTINNNTIIESSTNSSMNFSNLKVDMRVYIEFTAANSGVAKYITILK